MEEEFHRCGDGLYKDGQGNFYAVGRKIGFFERKRRGLSRIINRGEILIQLPENVAESLYKNHRRVLEEQQREADWLRAQHLEF